MLHEKMLFLVALGIMLLASNGFSQTTQVDVYTVHGTTCVPVQEGEDSTDSEEMIVRASGSGWVFRTGQTGNAVLYCSIPTVPVGASALELVYRDTDGRGENSQVFATLLRTEDLTTTFGVVSVFSNSSRATEMNVLRGDLPVTEDISLNLFRSSYFVRVVMERTNSSENPLFRAVRLLFVLF